MRRKIKFRRLSQAALEFLMTYGWAILVVLIAVAALSYFGVLSPDNYSHDACVLPAGMACIDYRVENYKAVVVLQNSLGDTVTINQVLISNGGQQCYDNTSAILNSGDKMVVTVLSCSNGATGSRFKGILNISYSVEGKLDHKASGSLITRVSEGASVSSQSACQNAETNGLCDGLDIVYGGGYKAACCSEHSLCC